MPLTTLDHAKEYNNLGWKVFPLKSRSKEPFLKWREFEKKPPSDRQLESWFKDRPFNIGIITGKASEIIVVDFDSKNAIERYRHEISDPYDTMHQYTGQGLQAFYRHPNTEIPNRAKLFEATDIRGDGGYVVAPPSTHPSGKIYTWGNLNPFDSPDDIQSIPDELLVALSQGNRASSESPLPKKSLSPTDRRTVNEILLEGSCQGTRNSDAATVAGKILAENNDPEFALIQLRGWNTLNKPPLEDSELQKIITSIHKAETRKRANIKKNANIQSINKLVYADGSEATYLVTIGGSEVIMTADDLVNPWRYRKRLFDITNVLIPPITPKAWTPVINSFMQECKVTYVDEDETPIEAVKRIVLDDVYVNHEWQVDEKPELFMTDRAVIIKDHVCVRLSVVKRNMRTDGESNINQKLLGMWLRKAGFKKRTIRVGESTYKMWKISKGELFKCLTS
jgi:hypothetical protein